MPASAIDKLQAILSAVFLSKVARNRDHLVPYLMLSIFYVYCLRREWKIFVQPVKKLCNKADFYGQSQMSFVAQVRPQAADIFITTAHAKYVDVLFKHCNAIFQPTNIRRIGTNIQILREKKNINSFFSFRIHNPSCFLFSVIFVGMRVVEHFSRSQMQIQLGIALKTRRLLEQNP